jgi:hypothetical protein
MGISYSVITSSRHLSVKRARGAHRRSRKRLESGPYAKKRSSIKPCLQSPAEECPPLSVCSLGLVNANFSLVPQRFGACAKTSACKQECTIHQVQYAALNLLPCLAKEIDWIHLLQQHPRASTVAMLSDEPLGQELLRGEAKHVSIVFGSFPNSEKSRIGTITSATTVCSTMGNAAAVPHQQATTWWPSASKGHVPALLDASLSMLLCSQSLAIQLCVLHKWTNMLVDTQASWLQVWCHASNLRLRRTTAQAPADCLQRCWD